MRNQANVSQVASIYSFYPGV